MLAMFRRWLNTWPARLFFGVLVLSFGLWGIADVVRNVGTDTSAASVGGQRIEMPELQEAYQRDLGAATRMLGNIDPTPQLRRAVAMQTIGQLITQKALLQAVARPRRQGAENRARRRHHQRAGVPQRAGPVRPQPGARGAAQQRAQRAARSATCCAATSPASRCWTRSPPASCRPPEMVDAGVRVPAREARRRRRATCRSPPPPPPPTPTEAEIERWWANHPEKYSKPEYRRIKAIVLSPETLANEITVTEDDLKARVGAAQGRVRQARAALGAGDPDPGRRPRPKRLAAQWRGGADWAAMQQEAAKAAAAPVELDDATRTEFPAPELGSAVFATPLDVMPPPVHSALGWHVLQGHQDRPRRHQNLRRGRARSCASLCIADKAADLMYDRANKIENLLSSGSSLDDLPGDLGVAAVTGTLDAAGRHAGPASRRRSPAPPSCAPAWSRRRSRPSRATRRSSSQAPNAPDGSQSFFALTVEKIIPPALKPLAEVEAQVRADWAAQPAAPRPGGGGGEAATARSSAASPSPRRRRRPGSPCSPCRRPAAPRRPRASRPRCSRRCSA